MIGMGRDSKEFACELGHAIARQCQINEDRINKDNLHRFWSLITDENFETRLETFIHMLVIYTSLLPFTSNLSTLIRI